MLSVLSFPNKLVEHTSVGWRKSYYVYGLGQGHPLAFPQATTIHNFITEKVLGQLWYIPTIGGSYFDTKEKTSFLTCNGAPPLEGGQPATATGIGGILDGSTPNPIAGPKEPFWVRVSVVFLLPTELRT